MVENVASSGGTIERTSRRTGARGLKLRRKDALKRAFGLKSELSEAEARKETVTERNKNRDEYLIENGGTHFYEEDKIEDMGEQRSNLLRNIWRECCP